uniref:Poly(A) specific ribonuclease subunit PAN3 n=1 Tax=Rousettus aegyptiacus TaxID=9407 RepID=A0A7J8DYR9_ROUAE|nr:poly(A) specific ribonuclease subunit PAN3 [Rousettus aegyptiacus]
MRSVNDIMPMIGARFYTQLDAAQMRNDVIEEDLAKEVQNGRLFRLLAKLGTINERPEFQKDPTWSETGDRYLLKLFRDHLFHQLDAGVPEKISLTSRDEKSVLVVAYSDLKRCFENTFQELIAAANGRLLIPENSRIKDVNFPDLPVVTERTESTALESCSVAHFTFLYLFEVRLLYLLHCKYF